MATFKAGQIDPELDMEGANQLMEAWRQHYGLGDQGN
jgi:hypothetical protein